MNLQEATMKALQGKLYENVELNPNPNNQPKLYKNNVVVTGDMNKIKFGEILNFWSTVEDYGFYFTLEVVNANEVFTKVSDIEYGKCMLFLTVYYKDGIRYKAGDGDFMIELWFNQDPQSYYSDFESDDIKPDRPEYKIVYDKCDELLQSKGTSMKKIIERILDDNPYTLFPSFG